MPAIQIGIHTAWGKTDKCSLFSTTGTGKTFSHLFRRTFHETIFAKNMGK
jgi:hypothetical protein